MSNFRHTLHTKKYYFRLFTQKNELSAFTESIKPINALAQRVVCQSIYASVARVLRHLNACFVV